MNNFEEAMANIRSAFRLLYHFNEQIISLIKYIGKVFDLESKWDVNHYFNPPINFKKNLNGREHGWHWLPLYFYEFHFEKEKTKFSVFLQCDTGAWNVNSWEKVDSFQNINESKTKLLLAISNSKDWCIDMHVIDDNYDSFLNDELKIKISKNNEVYIKSYDIINFKDKEATNETLKDFVKFTEGKGITEINFNDDNI